MVKRPKLTIRLKPENHKWVQHRAVDKSIPVNTLIEQLIERERAKVEARQ